MIGRSPVFSPARLPDPMRLLVLFLFLAAEVVAQVNTERMRRRLGDDGAALSVDASAAFATGNSAYTILGLGGRVDVQRGPHFAFVVGRFDLSRAGGNAFVDRQFAHLRYNRDLSGWLVAEAFTQVERNPQQRLRQRTLLGGGLRAEILDRDSLGVAVAVTPMVEAERLDEALGEDDAPRVRLSSYVAGRVLLPSGASLTTTTYFQPRADRPGDLRVLSQAALSVPVTGALRLRASANLRHDSDPPLGVEATDLSVETGFVLVLPTG